MVRKAASGQTEKKHKLQSVDLYKMKWRVVNRAEVIGDVRCITGQLISLFNSVIYTRRFVEDTAA